MKRKFVFAGIAAVIAAYVAAKKLRKKTEAEERKKDLRVMKRQLRIIGILVRKGGEWRDVPQVVKDGFLHRLKESGVEETILKLKRGDDCPTFVIRVQGYACFLTVHFIPRCIREKFPSKET